MTLLIPTLKCKEMAQQIADAACCLDDLGSLESSQQVMYEALSKAQEYAQTLHNIARFMAGPHADEIYRTDKELPPAEECGDAVTGQACRNTSRERCGECLALTQQAPIVAAAGMTA